MYPLPAPSNTALGKSIQKDKDMSTMKYSQEFGALPPSEGRNKDIQVGIFQVVQDGGAPAEQEIAYDLVTRQPLAPAAWEAKKGADVMLRLAYRDDDNNLSPFTEFHFGLAADTIAPDAPAAIGKTTVVDEVDE